MDELTYFAGDIDADKVPALVTTLFRMADDLDVDVDRGRGFMAMANNQLRIHWVLNGLVNRRFNQEERDAIYRQAIATASLECATDFAESCVGDHTLREDGRRGRDQPLVSQAVAEEFRELALEKLRAAAADGTLSSHPKLVVMLFAWHRLNGETSAEIRTWTDAALVDDAFVVELRPVVSSIRRVAAISLGAPIAPGAWRIGV